MVLTLSATLVLTLIFFFNDPATTEIYTLSLHDALPIYPHRLAQGARFRRGDRRRGAQDRVRGPLDRKSTRLNSSHTVISYAVFCLKKKKRRTYMFINPEYRLKTRIHLNLICSVLLLVTH